jgi:outer membrane protein assembly factor BamB
MTFRTQAGALQPDRSVLVVGTHGRICGVDRATGELLWKNELPSGSYGEVFIAVGHGVVIASADGAVIFCLDYLTGHERWRSPTSASGRATIVMEPDQIVCAKGGYIDCFDPEGHHLWSQPLKGFGVGRVSLGLPGNVAQADDIGSE